MSKLPNIDSANNESMINRNISRTNLRQPPAIGGAVE
jgi:hypothetical protein